MMAEAERKEGTRREEKIGCSLLSDNFLLYSYLLRTSKTSGPQPQWSTMELCCYQCNPLIFTQLRTWLRSSCTAWCPTTMYCFKQIHWILSLILGSAVLARIFFIRKLNRGKLLSELGISLVNSEK